MSRLTSLAVVAVLAAAPSAAHASTPRPAGDLAAPSAAQAHKAKPAKKSAPRRGGKVRRAWPRAKTAKPSAPLARFLARQVGPAPKPKRAQVKTGRSGYAAVIGTAASSSATQQVPFTGPVLDKPLNLIRSFEIPDADPSAERLANLSWTYNSAVAAAAFTESGLVTQARQLLDQLAALQRADGSIDYAFNTRTGQSIAMYRSGAIAWVGLATTAFRQQFCSESYDTTAQLAAQWLLRQQGADPAQRSYGLVVGGPDVTWASTQHNLLTRAFWLALADSLEQKADSSDHDRGWGNDKCKNIKPTSADKTLAATLRAAAARIDTAIDRELLVRPAAGKAYFRQGVADDVRPVDTQALGILWLLDRGRTADAQAVRSYTDATMLIANRSIVPSLALDTFNSAFRATGPFLGYKPYADAGAPDVLWAEGTTQMRIAAKRLGADTRLLDASAVVWQIVSGITNGPLQADRTVTGNPYNEYHVWPDAAAAAWTLLNVADSRLLG